MTPDPNDAPKIHVDDDWKSEAAKEKERLAQETQDLGGRSDLPDPSFMEIVNLIVMQAAVSLGGMQGPDGRTMQPDLGLARHYIDLLAVLQDKTKGHLTQEEEQTINGVLHELRMRFVASASGPSAGQQPQSQQNQSQQGGPAGEGPKIITD